MADPLTLAAEQLAPSRASTNFFDPAAGQDILSRYANTRIAGEGSATVAEASSRLADDRMKRAEDRRRTTAWDRDEAEYQEKQEFKAGRGEFLEKIALIDPLADDYDDMISSITSAMPPAALKDDGVVALLTHKNRLADSARTEREMQQRRKETLDDRFKVEKFKRSNDPRLSVLTPEEHKSFETTDGYDFVGAGILADTKKREKDIADKKEIISTTQDYKANKEAADKRRKDTRGLIEGDRTAFRSQLDVLRSQNPGVSDEDLKKEVPQEYAAAALWDKNPYASELGAAYNRATAEEYVNLASDKLTKEQKDKRRAVWKLAREIYDGETEETVPDAKPAAPATPAAPKTLTPEAKADILKRAGGDPQKAKQIAIAEGY